MTHSQAARDMVVRVRGWLTEVRRIDRRSAGLTAARLVLLILTGTLQSVPSWAQGPAPLDRDPIRCWWRTTTGAVQTGETFTVVLTCTVLEQETVRVVADETQLDPSTVSMAPFEVVSGTHPADLRTPERRFFQRVYTLRIINPDAIGEDVRLPPLTIRYHVQNSVAGAASVDGRELVYLLPPQPIRVLSIVPEEATDIRDAGTETFDEIPALTFRGNSLRIAAAGLIGLGAIMAVLALVQLATGRTKKPKTDGEDLPARLLLGAASRQLSEVEREVAQIGWTDPLMSRALAALRIGAACALGRRLGYGVQTGRAPVQDGQLLIHRRGHGPSAVSSGVTAEDLRSVLASHAGSELASDRQQVLTQLHSSIASLSGTRFGRPAPFDGRTLDEALTSGAAAVNTLVSEHAWPRAYLRWRRPPAEVGSYT